MISIKNLCKTYKETLVFNEYNVDFSKGIVNVLTGKSGCGKTTLLKILLKLEDMDSGQVVGIDNLKFSAVFQEDRLCDNLTVSMNVRLPILNKDETKTKEEIKENLNKIGLNGLANKKVSNLSGGMKRRVSILRALMSDFDIIVFDEALKGLDNDTKDLVMNLINEKTNGKTVFWVTHDINEVKYFEKYKVFNI